MTGMQKTMAIFAGSVNPGLANGIVKELGCELGNVKLEKFANGEIYARYGESVRGASRSVSSEGTENMSSSTWPSIVIEK